jgi:hypothetical protein
VWGNMRSRCFLISFKDQIGSFEISLQKVNKSSENTLSIRGKPYKVVGSKPAIAQLRSHLISNTFDSFDEFSATLSRNIASERENSINPQDISDETPVSSMGSAEKQFWKWLNVQDSLEKMQFEKFKPNFKTNADYLKGNLQFFKSIQGFNFIKIVESSPSRVTVLLQEYCASQQYALLTIEVEAESPHLIHRKSFETLS